MLKNIKDYQHIHLIGIGGASMYSIAAMLHNDSLKVTGSDISLSENVQHLRDLGLQIAIGHDINLVKDADLVVYTAAIKDDDEELVYAKNNNIEAVDRAVFLGEYTKNYENLICISGTHGKSTTTSMVASVFLEANLNPTINIGASLKRIKGNYYIGDKKYFILEACEYVDSFLHFHPTSEIILNIDDDHLDYFKNIDNIKKSFYKYGELLPQDGFMVINVDDKNTQDLLNIKRPKITYAIDNKEADYQARNITYTDLGFPNFDVYYKNELIGNFTLGVLGRHNILNALATIALARNYNIDSNIIQKALANFRGVHRRFEYLGKYHKATLIDDFAHHPTEIMATYNSTKNLKYHESWAIFQAHTYSRTVEHLEEFASILAKFDHVIICDIYPARETNIWNVKESDLVDLIKKDNLQVCHIATYEEIAKYLKNNIQDSDLILTIGAGPINKVAEILLKEEK